MKKPLKCKLGFHHWHYDPKIADGWFYVDAVCFQCGKIDLISGLTVAEWFRFGEAQIWDKHNPTLQAVLGVKS